MAATKANSILLAALALPGLAAADTPPEQASLSLRWLDYRDSQPNLDRIQVHSPAVALEVPLGEWSVRAGLVADTVSGASPRYHTALSGASHMHDRRLGADAAVTRYFEHASVTVSAGRSGENDYVSHFGALSVSLSSDDKNRTWTLGAGGSRDTINPVNLIVTDEHKRSTELMAGVTQVWSTRDLVAALFTHTSGRGYFSDPYRYVDKRPREQNRDTLQLRWNHGFDQATSRLSYRYYQDSWGVTAHTLEEELVLPVSASLTLAPSLRLSTQSAARFYFDPVYDKRFGPPFPPGFDFTANQILSADQRLSAFGARTLGLQATWAVNASWSLDLKWEQYQQRSAWRWFGRGSPGLSDFNARNLQFGFTTRW